MRKKKEVFVLQHKYPWADWIDVVEDRELESEKFYKVLKDEPQHLISMEYRIIKKSTIKLKSKDNKVVVKDECIYGGSEMATFLSDFKGK